jgi:hypothetical protein
VPHNCALDPRTLFRPRRLPVGQGNTSTLEEISMNNPNNPSQNPGQSSNPKPGQQGGGQKPDQQQQGGQKPDQQHQGGEHKPGQGGQNR